MQDVFYVEEVEQATTLLKPVRIELLKRMDEPRTCSELAEQFGDTPQRMYYHVKALEKAGLVEKVGERRVRGIIEGSYQAKARAYWLAPHLVGDIGGSRPAQDQASLHFLLSLAADMHDDIGHLAHRVGQDVPSVGLAAHIHLKGERRAAFLQDVQRIFEDLARTYGNTEEEERVAPGESFKLVLACYPDR